MYVLKYVGYYARRYASARSYARAAFSGSRRRRHPEVSVEEQQLQLAVLLKRERICDWKNTESVRFCIAGFVKGALQFMFR